MGGMSTKKPLGNNAPNADSKQIWGSRGFGTHLMDPNQQGGLLEVSGVPQMLQGNWAGLYGRIFGAGAQEKSGLNGLASPGGMFDRPDSRAPDQAKKAAKRDAKLQGDLQRQQALASGAGGGGAQAGAESQAHTAVMSQFAAQQEQLRQQQQQRDMSTLMLIFSLIGGGGGAGMGGASLFNNGAAKKPGGSWQGSGF